MIKAFKIESIEYGWFDVRIGKFYVECSDYLGYDTPKILLGALINLAKNITKEEWVCWQDEPAARIMYLMRENNHIKIEIFHATEDSYDIDLSKNTLCSYCGEGWGNVKVEIVELLDNFVTEFSLYENGNGLALYEEHWMKFPIEEFNCLKEVLHSLAGELGNKDLFFDSYYNRKK